MAKRIRVLRVTNNYGIQRNTTGYRKKYVCAEKRAESPRRIASPSSPSSCLELNRFLERELFRDKIDRPVSLA